MSDDLTGRKHTRPASAGRDLVDDVDLQLLSELFVPGVADVEVCARPPAGFVPAYRS